MNKSNKYSPEAKDRAVRLVQDHRAIKEAHRATLGNLRSCNAPPKTKLGRSPQE